MIVIGSITNNVLTAYSSGLALQAVGIPWSRAVTVFFDGAVGVAITCYALFLSNFLDTLNNILAMSVALLAPSLTIYAADILLRRNRYNGTRPARRDARQPVLVHRRRQLGRRRRPGRRDDVSVLCMDTTLVVGPVARSLGGADLSALAGPVVAAAVYTTATVLARRTGAVRRPERVTAAWAPVAVAVAD